MSRSDDDDDDYAFYGTPLEQFEEEAVPRKKPVSVQDQIVTDKHGRRRFHGAFTGGFSAGFYNTVGSLEGWTPASFKSSRDKKADSNFQKPEDFMDEEDMEEFGIAPKVVRAKPEYSGTKAQKRERVQFSEGPIPGEPVLKSILEPVRETIGVLLLMKMGWKPGQGIGPRLTRLQKKKEKMKKKIKVYGCSLPNQASNSDDGEEDTFDDIDPNVLFAPVEYEIHFLHPKADTLGMDYTGLEKNSLFSNNSFQKSETFRMFDNNKKLAIKGQAFGVGAFEDEDDDIYAREDMSQYDFALETSSSLKEKRRKEREANKFLAVTDLSNILEGFVPAFNPVPPKKLFPPPDLPAHYEPVHPKRKTRFDPPLPKANDVKYESRHYITAHDRAAILEDQRPKNIKNDESKEEPEVQTTDSLLKGFRPFLADPEKQHRYERYLQLVKIGAKDAFPSIQPKSMNEWEKERERCEFEQAARLYKPLSGLMAERFAHGELSDDSADPLSTVPRSTIGEDADMVQAAKSKMFGKLTRRITDWNPCSLLCKRMNIAEPLNGSGVSLCQIANKKKENRSKFSVFSFLDVCKENSFGENSLNKTSSPVKESGDSDNQKLFDSETGNNLKNLITLPEEPVINFEDPLEKKDLFKAIFCSDEENEEEENKDDLKKAEKTITTTINSKTLTVANALRNTSPPRGIFANLDLDAINKRKTTTASNPVMSPIPSNSVSAESVKDSKEKVEEKIEENVYGPSLPTKPYFSLKPQKTVVKSSSDSSSEEEWVERKEEKEKKKHKKHKKSKKKHKSKNKKKECRNRCK